MLTSHSMNLSPQDFCGSHGGAVRWAVPDVLRDHSAISSGSNNPRKKTLSAWSWRRRHTFTTLESTHPNRWHHISSVYQPHHSASDCITGTTEQNESQWLTQTAECTTTGRPVHKTYGAILYVSCEWQQYHFSPYPSNGTSSCFPHITVKDLVWIFPKRVLLMSWQQL